MRQKHNISSLENVKILESESLHDFMKRFRQVVLQVESYNINSLVQTFKICISLNTLFFEFILKIPLR